MGKTPAMEGVTVPAPMHIYCLGLNHQNTSVDLRERLSFSPHQIETALARLGCGSDPATLAIQEMAILSTCNRVEVYAVASRGAFAVLESFLAETRGFAQDAFTPYVYRFVDGEAVAHLMQVAAGLDSLVLGEPQILGQVTQALAVARSQGTAGKILSRLFQAAIHAGKRARTETKISQNPASVASVAVRLIANAVADLARLRVLVLGAGETAELAVEALIKRGVSDIWVVNRTLERAHHLAERWASQAFSFEALPELLPAADVLIASTGAPLTVIHPELVAQSLAKRPHRPLVIMDIAVPRDVDPEVEQLPGVRLYDMDALSTGLADSLAKRESEVGKVLDILAEEQRTFMNFFLTLDVLPIIIEIRQQAQAIREEEFQKTMRRLPDMSPEMEKHIDALTKAIVKKILHSPTIRLREEANGPNAADYADIARGLFGLG